MASDSSEALTIERGRVVRPARGVQGGRRAVVASGWVFIFGVVPIIGNDYWLNAILIPFLVLALAGLGLNLLTGFAGQASLGSGALMSVGAFASYNLLLRLPMLPLPISMFLGGLIAAAVGMG